MGASWLERPDVKTKNALIIIDSLGIQPGQVVADIGAGSGYFTRRLSAKVGQEGRVMAVDIQPEMLEILRRDLTPQEFQRNHDPGRKLLQMPPNSVDLVLMVDVYHEFSFPHEMMTQIHSALKPGGQVVWVEYRLEDPTVPIKLLHKMSRQQVHKEATFQGLSLSGLTRGFQTACAILQEIIERRTYPNLKALKCLIHWSPPASARAAALLVAIVSMSWLEAQENSPENKPQVLIPDISWRTSLSFGRRLRRKPLLISSIWQKAARRSPTAKPARRSPAHFMMA